LVKEFRVSSENLVQTRPFRAFSIDPRHVSSFEQVRVVAKITDDEIPVTVALPHRPMRMQGFIAGPNNV
jgi:hypothetical protein